MSAVAPDLIPVRALNQATYCPRLYYLQYVDCVMPTNEHVEGGLFDHRRVDDPDLKLKTRTDGDTARTRGVPVSSDALGLSGVMDQIEEKNGERYPVETKHGTAPRDADGQPTTWDNDAVQLCAQAMLLEEQSGEPVGRGFQFYAGSRERVAVEFTPELRRKTLDTIARCRDLSAADAPPPPLTKQQFAAPGVQTVKGTIVSVLPDGGGLKLMTGGKNKQEVDVRFSEETKFVAKDGSTIK